VYGRLGYLLQGRWVFGYERVSDFNGDNDGNDEEEI
jgi:hypothetical protein